jgi:hypothetical protein
VYAIDPLRTDLALAFRQRPFGPHPAEVAALVTALRMGPVSGKLVLIAAADGRSWELARLSGRRGEPPQKTGEICTDRAAAEWAVFKRRWEARTGVPLEID